MLNSTWISKIVYSVNGYGDQSSSFDLGFDFTKRKIVVYALWGNDARFRFVKTVGTIFIGNHLLFGL